LATRTTSSDGSATIDCESDLDCPEGEECEFEHGGSFCKPHGSNDHDDGASGTGGTGGTAGIDGTGGTAGIGGSGGSAGIDGTGGSAGINGSVMECESDYDCPAGEECEFEHGDSFCKPHGGDDDEDDYRDDRSGSNSGKG
jgi:hypothetical protein